MAAGRPSKYKPAYCEEIIQLMADGLSLTAACAELGIVPETARAWEKDGQHPEFSAAVKIARAKRTLRLERELLMAKEGPVVTARIFALKNACADEWREKVDTQVTGKDGGPIEHKHDLPSDSDFAKAILGLIQAAAK